MSTFPSSTARQMSFRSKYKPEKYGGTTDCSDYLKHFERVAQWNGWSDNDKAARLSMSLKLEWLVKSGLIVQRMVVMNPW